MSLFPVLQLPSPLMSVSCVITTQSINVLLGRYTMFYINISIFTHRKGVYVFPTYCCRSVFMLPTIKMNGLYLLIMLGYIIYKLSCEEK
jgi:hypothetical protein